MNIRKAVIKPRVLIFERDGDRVIGDTLGIILRRRGYEARAIYDLASAIQAMHTFRPHAAIIEFLLKDGLATEAAKALRQINPDLPLMIYGGFPEYLDDITREHPELVFMALKKPVHPMVILAEVDRLLLRPNAIYHA